MDVVEASSWSLFGLEGVLLLAGVVLAGFRRRSHPTAARLAVAGLLGVLCCNFLRVGISLFYPRLPPGQGSAEYWQAQQFGLLSLHHVVSFIGAVGWALVLGAIYVQGGQPQAAGQEQIRDAH
ncbi:hypothetical protein [Microlunatus speluncae]|uniref:hypothetical protein n=1 Tax=Microlunatus speluncae TaxID=2594267 RepID=UPI0012663684|nr:hypothetical protein [Microlunatus speluncae]